MAGRRTNLALLVLLAGALATGALAYAIGSGWGRVVVIAHGALALAIVLLVPWKSAIAPRGLRRRRAGSWASVAFAALSGRPSCSVCCMPRAWPWTWDRSAGCR